ncbi:hypothetical protein NECAME_01612 [Necator americanus]|uniref:Transmembrane protein n=1 Tax=Necator americanus TaxID=51031 RepID=W2TRU3_NECAM|nr:hypothetical protein NECAME_01612 [Necator americanus]ETN84389.1 hypothetical protein NECAME_01612 [Necator americanus]
MLFLPSTMRFKCDSALRPSSRTGGGGAKYGLLYEEHRDATRGVPLLRHAYFRAPQRVSLFRVVSLWFLPLVGLQSAACTPASSPAPSFRQSSSRSAPSIAITLSPRTLVPCVSPVFFIVSVYVRAFSLAVAVSLADCCVIILLCLRL